MDRVVSVGCKSWLWVVMLCGGRPTRVSEETPAASCSALPHTGDRIGSSLRLGTDQSSLANARRCRSLVIRVVLGLYPTERHRSAVPQIRRLVPQRRHMRCSKISRQFCASRKPTIAICRVMLFSLSAGLLGEIQLTRDLVFGRKRAQFVPGRRRSCDVPAPADIRSRPDRTRRASLRTAASI